MFQYIVEPTPPISRKKVYVLPLSIVTHLVIVVAAIAIPMFAPSVLPVPATNLMAFISHDVVTPPPPPAAPPRVTANTQPQPDATNVNLNAAPVVTPAAIGTEPIGEATRGLIRGVEATDRTLIGSGLGSVVDVAPPPAAIEPPATIRVGGNVTPPKKIHDVAPIYPAFAQAAHVSGMVIIEATIGPNGDVLDAKVLRSIPLLDASALDAVRRWRYTSTLLNGKPVAVVMTVTVTFQLR
jgi:periplasmic protein TonB